MAVFFGRKIMKLISRALIAMDAFIKGHKKGKVNNKNILIVFQQALGDSVILQSSLSAYPKLFQGCKIVMVVQPSVLAFMKENLPLPSEIEFEAVDFKKFLADYGYYREVVERYKNFAGTVIVTGTSLSAEVFTSAMNASRKIGLVRPVDLTKPLIMAVFAKLAYTERVRPNKEDMMLQNHRRLVHYLGDKDYKARLPQLLKKERIIETSYAVICPGASLTEKCWPVERFAEVADMLVEKFGLEIHLCGSKGEERFGEEMKKLSSHPEKIVSHIGTTSFSDWSAIVQHAEIVIGNDSATMHIAAAARVKSVCIAGVYDRNSFFPYQVDELDEGDVLPTTLLKDMPCQWCRTVGYYAGFGNDECKKRIDEGRCATCVDLVTVEEAKKCL